MSNSPIPFSDNSKDERNREFENTLGNLFVAEYQLYRLRERLKNHLDRTSTFIYKHENKWYKISMNVEVFDPETENKEAVHEEVEPGQTHGFSPGTFTDWEEDVGVP
jgi:hypothetical protein